MIHQQLDEFQHALLNLARAELPNARFHDDHAQRFDLNGETYTTEWPLADDKGWRFFRLADGHLADSLIAQAKARDLDQGTSRQFDYGACSDNLGDVEAQISAGRPAF